MTPPPTKPYTPPADTEKHPTTSNSGPPVLAVPALARHSTAAVVSLATARFAVSYRRGGSHLMGDVYSMEWSHFERLRGSKCPLCACFSHLGIFRTNLLTHTPVRLRFARFWRQSVTPPPPDSPWPTAYLLRRSKLLAVAPFRPMMSPIVTHRSYTPTDSIIEFYDLENCGPPTHASYRHPRFHRRH
ncbi:hypothetical protein C8J57DRAFT_111712 [Mycena rebaudengoi]|nr:hypothetical protein C8J57DRAFT_111712 [Mycena rebaudengoi]